MQNLDKRVAALELAATATEPKRPAILLNMDMNETEAQAL